MVIIYKIIAGTKNIFMKETFMCKHLETINFMFKNKIKIELEENIFCSKIELRNKNNLL